MTLRDDYPILQFDPAQKAMIEPGRFYDFKPPVGVPERCVMCFFFEVFEKLLGEGRLSLIQNLRSEMGKHPVYRLDINGPQLAVMHPGVGAPLSAGLMEEAIFLGCKRFIAVGGAGVLDSEIGMGQVVIPTTAVRDEGTSYHYLPPGEDAIPTPGAVLAIKTVLARHDVEFRLGKTWTTDAFYRETPAKVALRKSQGCLTVEMEAAAFFAVAQFRGVSIGQMLYGGDDVGGAEWDSRDWEKAASTREKLFWLAAEAALEA